MRKLFEHVFDAGADWVVWLDDDSYFTDTSWLSKLGSLFRNKEVDVVGKTYWMTYAPQQKFWIRSAYWYRGLPFDNRDGDEGVRFPVGGFWAARRALTSAANCMNLGAAWSRNCL